MDDDLLDQYYEHKKGDIVKLKSYHNEKDNEWEVVRYLIGGYKLLNIHNKRITEVETKEVSFAEANLSKIPGHEDHDVVVTYVANPQYDRYIYCRDCKKELKTRYKKIPMPKNVFFIK